MSGMLLIFSNIVHTCFQLSDGTLENFFMDDEMTAIQWIKLFTTQDLFYLGRFTPYLERPRLRSLTPLRS